MTNLIYVDWLFIYAGAPYQISIGPKVQLVSVLLSISTLILSIPDYHGYSRSNNIHKHTHTRLHNCKQYCVGNVCLNYIQRVGIYILVTLIHSLNCDALSAASTGGWDPQVFFIYLNRPGDSANLEAREQVAIKPWCATPTMPTNQEHVTYNMNVGVN